MNETLTLFELNSLVRDVVEGNFDEEYWVVGELSDVSTPAFGGHFYGELVQKDEESDRIVARARITCWARNYNIIRLRFQKEAGETLRKGLQVKLQVKVNFHEQYGYSLNVLDIEKFALAAHRHGVPLFHRARPLAGLHRAPVPLRHTHRCRRQHHALLPHGDAR